MRVTGRIFPAPMRHAGGTPTATILRALMVILAVLLVGLATKTHHHVKAMHADRDALAIWNVVQLEADYRDLVLASHNARALARIWPDRDIAKALAQFRGDLGDFDSAATAFLETLRRNDLAQDFDVAIAQLGAARQDLAARVTTLSPRPEIAQEMAILHGRIATLAPMVGDLTKGASQRLMARAASLDQQEGAMRAAMTGISIVMMVMTLLAVLLAGHIARSQEMTGLPSARNEMPLQHARDEDRRLLVPDVQGDGASDAPVYMTAQDRLLATMSHDLRTPLHGVRTALDLLARQSLPGAADRLVAVAQQSCSHALAQSDRALNALQGVDIPERPNAFDPATPPAEPKAEMGLIGHDKGSAITLPLVRADTAGDAPHPALAQGGIGAGKTALVVDDARVNCDLVGQMLGQLGYRADIAFCGAEAVRMAKATAYDLILLDFEMPRMTGPEAALQITQSGPSARARIIGMTARVDLDAAHRGLPPGMVHVFIKPFGIAELEACLSVSPSPRHPPESFAPCKDEMALLCATLEMCGEVLGMALLQDTLGLAQHALAELDQDPDSCAETAHRAAGAAMMAGFHELGGALRDLEQAARAQVDQHALAPLAERLAMATRKAQATLGAIEAAGKTLAV